MESKNKRGKYNQLTLAQKKSIIFKSKSAKYTQSELSDLFSEKFGFNVPRKTIGNILLNSKSILEHEGDDSRIKQKTEKYPDLEKALFLWIDNATKNNMIINEQVILNKARSFAPNFDVDANFKFSHGWLQKFKKRNNLKQISLHGESGSVSEDTISIARENLNEMLTGYSPSCIYNMDETALFWKLRPNKTICSLAKKHGTKQSKARITVGLCVNSDGSHKLKPLVIGTAAKPVAFRRFNVNLFVDYFSNKKAWMTSIIFNEWLKNFDNSMTNLRKKVCLIIDNAPSHKCLIELKSTKLVFLLPNVTSHLQPLDAGIICSFKRFYKNLLVSDAIKAFEKQETHLLNIRIAIEWLVESWHNVETMTISNCYKHCGINNEIQQMAPIEESNEALQEAIDLLSIRSKEECISANDFIDIDKNEIKDQILHGLDEEIIDLVKSDDLVSEENDEDQMNIDDIPVISNEQAKNSLENIIKYISQNDIQTDSDILKSLFELKKIIKIKDQPQYKQSSMYEYLK